MPLGSLPSLKMSVFPRGLLLALATSGLIGATALRRQSSTSSELPDVDPNALEFRALGGKRPGVRFIKIQKTGSTSFGDFVVPQFCGAGSVCHSSAHMDWNQATFNGTYTGPVVTLLRDPVDRLFSEFFFLRDTDGILSSTQAQWDFRNRTWLRAVQQENNITKALEAFIRGYPKNPSRNRQALYLMGFRDSSTWGIDDRQHKQPGEAYAWDEHPGAHARHALDHLEGLTAFGITECWTSSMRAIARALGWDVQAVERATADRHERNWRKAMVDRHKPDYWRLRSWLGKDIPNDSKWTEVLPRQFVAEVTKWSAVDGMIYKVAKKRFTEKFQEPCP